jgi:uncharacterized membrane protein YvbJ
MKCEKCGNINANQALFCTMCGNPLLAEDHQSNQKSTNRVTLSLGKWWWGIIIFAFLLSFLFVLLIDMDNRIKYIGNNNNFDIPKNFSSLQKKLKADLDSYLSKEKKRMISDLRLLFDKEENKIEEKIVYVDRRIKELQSTRDELQINSNKYREVLEEILNSTVISSLLVRWALEGLQTG